jgi:hypothetical protein
MSSSNFGPRLPSAFVIGFCYYCCRRVQGSQALEVKDVEAFQVRLMLALMIGCHEEPRLHRAAFFKALSSPELFPTSTSTSSSPHLSLHLPYSTSICPKVLPTTGISTRYLILSLLLSQSIQPLRYRPVAQLLSVASFQVPLPIRHYPPRPRYF